MGRILCVHFPHWPLQRRRAVQPELDQGGVAFHTAGPPARARLVHCSKKALEARLAPGMSLGTALSLAADPAFGIRFLPLEPAADRAMLEMLAMQAVRFAPRVGLDDACRPLPAGCEPFPADSLLFEIEGCTALWGGEAPYLDEVQDYFRLLGWKVRLATADTLGAAWAAAHYACAASGPPWIAPPGKEAQAAALRRLPLAALRLPEALLETLAALGWNALADLEGVERAAWSARFGTALGSRWDQLWGDVPEWFAPVEPPQRDEIRCRWEHPVEQTLVLRSWIEQLLQSLAPRLAARGLGVLRLACRLELEDHGQAELELRLLQPRSRPAYLAELLYWEWERRLRGAPLSAGVVGCGLEAVETAPIASRQRKLWSAPARGAEDDADRPLDEEQRQAFSQLVERLTSRLGDEAALQIRPEPEVDPASAYRLQPWRPAPPERPGRVAKSFPSRSQANAAWSNAAQTAPPEPGAEPTPRPPASQSAENGSANTRVFSSIEKPVKNARVKEEKIIQAEATSGTFPAAGRPAVPPRDATADGATDGASPEGGAASPRSRSRRRPAKRPPVRRGPPPSPKAFDAAPRPLRLAPEPIPLVVEFAGDADRLIPVRRRPLAEGTSETAPAACPRRLEWNASAAEPAGSTTRSDLNDQTDWKNPADGVARTERRLGPPVGAGSQAEVVRWWGPERLEGGWQREAAFARDYFQVETSRGERLWIFRSRPDDRWFLHGWFD